MQRTPEPLKHIKHIKHIRDIKDIKDRYVEHRAHSADRQDRNRAHRHSDRETDNAHRYKSDTIHEQAGTQTDTTKTRQLAHLMIFGQKRPDSRIDIISHTLRRKHADGCDALYTASDRHARLLRESLHKRPVLHPLEAPAHVSERARSL